MNIPLLDLKAQYEVIKEELCGAIQKVLEGGQYILGPSVKELEEKIALYCGTKFGVGIANGTDALLLVLLALGIGEGDEVITTPFTFFATTEVISQVGANPVFVDIEEDTFNIDVTKIEEKINKKTKAIMPVHIFGQMADMDNIMSLAEKHNLKIIEDACQAIGAEYKGKKAGSIGHAGCFSFFPTKNLGCYGDGGMIVTNDQEIDRKVRLLRAHGSNKKYYHSVIGFNSRLDEVQASILNVKLKYLNNWNEKRKQKADIYNKALLSSICTTPMVRDWNKSVYHLYVIRSSMRDKIATILQENGIASGVYYPLPLHLQQVYKDLGYKEGDLPNAELASKEVLALPLYPELEEEQIKMICTIINELGGV